MPFDHSYQWALFRRLWAGVELLSDEEKAAATHFVLSSRCSAGGFRGRGGEADMYYTAFALRALALLGTIQDEVLLEGVRKFLHPFSWSRAEGVTGTPADLFSYIFCCSLVGGLGHGTERRHLIDGWKKFRVSDGCFAASTATRYSSTYTTFLAASAFEILEAVTEKEAIETASILARQRADGGFVELEPLKQSGTNPTAAAIALLKMKGTQPTNAGAAGEFLRARQLPDGGFQANTRIPVSDLLSSFTALVALIDLGEYHRCNLDVLQKYAESMKTPDGGFCGADWDRQSDVEYTFYGLALKALLAVTTKTLDG